MFKKNFFNFFPKTLDKTLTMCYTIIVPRKHTKLNKIHRKEVIKMFNKISLNMRKNGKTYGFIIPWLRYHEVREQLEEMGYTYVDYTVRNY
jgi:hypothetical protein